MSELADTIGNVMDEKAQQFEDNPEGWQKRLQAEMDASNKMLDAFRKTGGEIAARYIDKRPRKARETHVNLFTANVQTLKAMLYGKIPTVDVKRRFGDPQDSVGRVAAEAMRRLLNTDIERDGDGYAKALKLSLMDRLLVGLGVIRYRYVADFEDDEEIEAKYATDDQGNKVMDEETGEPKELAPAYTEKGGKKFEDAECDYVYWRDFGWSAGSKVWGDVRWVGFATDMTKKAMLDRFGKEKMVKAMVPMNAKAGRESREEGSQLKPDPYSRARVWEIWSKEHKKVFWFAEGARVILDSKDDPLQLEGFFPCPEPMMANLTNEALVPRSDFALAEDLYIRVDELATRIALLEDAIAVRGVFNGASKQVIKLLSTGAQNELIPVDEWASFAERGGVKGNIDWLPLDVIVAALEKLREQLQANIQLLFQVTGMSDILRGEAQAGATATEQAIKAKFAGVRVQDFQDEFARFASEGQRIKAEIIVGLFDDETIMSRSNMMWVQPDAQLLPQAVQLLRDRFWEYRIQVLPENISVTDYAAMKQERVELMQTLAQLLQVMLPMGQSAPQMLPFLLQIIQWMFASFKGASTMEGVFDQAVKAAEQMAQQAMQKAMQPPQPGPKEQAQIQVAQIKAKAEMGKAQAQQQQTQMDTQAHAAEHHVDMQRIQAEGQRDQAQHEMSIAKMEAQLRADAVRSTLPNQQNGKEK
jgi:hypothetical protein